MTARSPSIASDLDAASSLGGYRGVAGHWDEALADDGSIRPPWQKLFATALAQTPADAQARQELTRRLLKENGVTYNVPGEDDQDERPWQLDAWPLVISAEEWQQISAAVAQRARLLDMILGDIYGPRRLLHSGDLPPEVVLANPAFLRAATNIVPQRGTHLNLFAVDLARSPDGRWWVVGDRTDTPAGIGYALENRIICRRVFPDLIRDCMVERLARFFGEFRDRLLAMAGARSGDKEPRVVILTAGPYHSTYFEQVYLARYLGFSLVEGQDLTVRDQGVFLKTLSGLLPVDVIVRRVTSYYCDPLELRDDSLLGIPGLLQAARAGKVVLANAIGSGVAESPALLPFLPSLCQRLLSEDLLMPPVATWWCGQADALAHVRDGLDQLVVKHAFPTREAYAWLPGQASPGTSKTAEAFKAQIAENPHLFVGQEFVALSTAPTWQDGSLQPRHLMLRVFAVAQGHGEYTVMPGGLTRAGSSAESVMMSSQAGGGSKDTWVIGNAPPDSSTLLPTGTRVAALSRAGFILSSRLADDLFWLGRYMERIEFGCRLGRSVLHRITDETEQSHLPPLSFLLDLLTAHGRQQPLRTADLPSSTADFFARAITTSIFDEKNPGSIRGDIARVVRISTSVRDRLSHDAWRILRSLPDALAPGGARWAGPSEQLAALDAVLVRVQSFSGQSMDGMTRDKGWRFLDIGRRLERAANLGDLIRHALVRPISDEGTRLQALLDIANSSMTYRSRYVFGPEAAPVLDLLLADESNPRSVAFQLSALYQHTRDLRDNTNIEKGREQRIVQRAFSELRLLDVDALASLQRRGRRLQLALLLRRIRRAMEELSQTLTRSYLTHVQTARPLSGPLS